MCHTAVSRCRLQLVQQSCSLPASVLPTDSLPVQHSCLPQATSLLAPLHQGRTCPHQRGRTCPHQDGRTCPHQDGRTYPHQRGRTCPHQRSRTCPRQDGRTCPHQDRMPYFHQDGSVYKVNSSSASASSSVQESFATPLLPTFLSEQKPGWVMSLWGFAGVSGCTRSQGLPASTLRLPGCSRWAHWRRPRIRHGLGFWGAPWIKLERQGWPLTPMPGGSSLCRGMPHQVLPWR